ncbi:MAG: DNA-directed RNA polymerase subunit alpha C-terminal domain-containing protein [Bariatricus sp.]
MNKSREALVQTINDQLKDTTIEELKSRKGGDFRFPVFLNSEFMDRDVTELELSVRSYNCLRRAGFRRIGDLVDHIDGKEDLLKIRNLGRKSADEILMNLFLFHYSIMRPERKENYIERVKKMNQQRQD